VEADNLGDLSLVTLILYMLGILVLSLHGGRRSSLSCLVLVPRVVANGEYLRMCSPLVWPTTLVYEIHGWKAQLGFAGCTERTVPAIVAGTSRGYSENA
jgi:hypothetical protein